MDVLYQVIIANQKSRTDLLKWKLLLAAAIAGIAFGTKNIDVTLPRIDVILCCIPLVTAYIDLLCSHLSLRVQVIGRFIRTSNFDDPDNKLFTQYEEFVDLTRSHYNAFIFESWAMYVSSIILSFLVFAYGIYLALNNGFDYYSGTISFSGSLGIGFSVVIQRNYRNRQRVINNLQQKSSGQSPYAKA